MKRFSLLAMLILIVLAMAGCGESVMKANSPTRIFHMDIDSTPRGGEVFWHVLSRNDEVSSTNRYFLGLTPIEGTQNLRIVGLTKENAGDVQIVIEIEKKGYSRRTIYLDALSVLSDRGISINVELAPKN